MAWSIRNTPFGVAALEPLGGPAFSTPFGVAAREPGRHLALLRALHLSLSGSRRSGRASRPSLHSLKLSRGLSPLRVAFCAPFGVLPFARPSWCCLLRALQLSCLGCRLCAPFGVLPFARPSWCCLLRALHLSSVGCCLSRGAFRPSLRSCQLSRGLSPLLLRLSLLQSCFTNLVLSWWLVGPSYATLLKYRLAQLSSRPAEMRGLPRLSSLLFYPPRKKENEAFPLGVQLSLF